MRYRFTSLCAYLQMLVGVMLMLGGPMVAAAVLIMPPEIRSSLLLMPNGELPVVRLAVSAVLVIAGLGFGTGCVLRGSMALLSIRQRRALAGTNKRLRQLAATFDRYEANVWAFREGERQPRIRFQRETK